MKILEFAKKKEQFSIDLYTDLAGKARYQGLKNIFTMLAEEERRHYQLISDMAREAPTQMHAEPVLKHASSVFSKMQKGAVGLAFGDNEAELYKTARQYEQESRMFYLERATEAADERQKETFRKLAGEEQRHFVLLDSICDFVMRPLSYLEDAEFVHLENYTEEPF
jgi:rubrerythrin